MPPEEQRLKSFFSSFLSRFQTGLLIINFFFVGENESAASFFPSIGDSSTGVELRSAEQRGERRPIEREEGFSLPGLKIKTESRTEDEDEAR